MNVGAAESANPQYLLFQIFSGGPDPRSGTFHRGLTKDELPKIVRRVSETVRPVRGDPNRILGFAIGPIAMDQGDDDVRSVIREAFEVALANDMAVALHLDDYMFWGQARQANGRLLREIQGTAEWRDWSGTPAGGLEIGWLPNVRLPPQMCYESPAIIDFVTRWTRDIVGREVKTQYERLVRAGKSRLFAGVIIGWESNLAYGYCSLSHLGYSRERPPADFDRERERILQRHIERWAKGIHDAGIPRDLIFTHIGPISRRDYDKLTAMLTPSRIREIHQSTAFRAFWAAFNSYSRPGFSAYPEERRFEDIYDALRSHGGGPWAMAEGTNVVMQARAPGAAAQSGLPWEVYLARSFNHGASIVDIFGGFQGETAGFRRSTESEEALAAYRKFLRGERLIEDVR